MRLSPPHPQQLHHKNSSIQEKLNILTCADVYHVRCPVSLIAWHLSPGTCLAMPTFIWLLNSPQKWQKSKGQQGGFFLHFFVLLAGACTFLHSSSSNSNLHSKIPCTKRRKSMIQAPEHLFLGIFSNEGLSWNLNITTFYEYSALLLTSQNFFFFFFFCWKVNITYL